MLITNPLYLSMEYYFFILMFKKASKRIANRKCIIMVYASFIKRLVGLTKFWNSDRYLQFHNKEHAIMNTNPTVFCLNPPTLKKVQVDPLIQIAV